MQKISKLLFYTFLISLLSFTACIDDDVDDIFGDPIEKYLGTWRCEEQGSISGGGWNYEVRIIRNPSNTSEILIENFNLQGFNEKARALVTSNTMTIPQQNICDNTLEIKGNGSYSNNQISLSYTTNDGATLETFTGRFYKP